MSLFRRITRYRLAPNQDPRENRLTEVTAAVLERVDGLAHYVMEMVIADARERLDDDESASSRKNLSSTLDDMLERIRQLSSPRLRLTTQKTTASRKFVDLELCLSPQPGEPGDVLLFWIEVKHGAKPGETQLTDYEGDIDKEAAGQRLVVLLAPRQSVPDLADVPDTIPIVEWQAVADAVRAWSKRPDLGEVDHFLLSDYLCYLREEGLMADELLTTEHTFVMQAHPRAQETIARLMELTDTWIQGNWAAKTTFKYEEERWVIYPTAKGGSPVESWRNTAFDWGLFSDQHRDEYRNAWVFAAGAWFHRRGNLDAIKNSNPGWVDQQQSNGFELDKFGRPLFWRLVRYLYPEELLCRTTLDAQVELLGSWVVGSFELLADAPPLH